VFAPRPALAAALAAQGFLAGQPANVFGLTAAERNALFLPRTFQLRDAGGTLHPQVGGQNPPVSVSVGMKSPAGYRVVTLAMMEARNA
jgi:hypothetical protein